MRAGDVIVKVDGESVSQIHEISSLVRAARNKHTFPVVVVRDKKEVTLSVTVESVNRGMRPVSPHYQWRPLQLKMLSASADSSDGH
jgi:C-terminal processing protease CtpA/Prc